MTLRKEVTTYICTYLIQEPALAAWLNPGIEVSFKNRESVR